LETQGSIFALISGQPAWFASGDMGVHRNFSMVGHRRHLSFSGCWRCNAYWRSQNTKKMSHLTATVTKRALLV